MTSSSFNLRAILIVSLAQLICACGSDSKYHGVPYPPADRTAIDADNQAAQAARIGKAASDLEKAGNRQNAEFLKQQNRSMESLRRASERSRHGENILNGASWKVVEAEKLEKNWNGTRFDAAKFRSADAKARTAMAIDIIRSKMFVGLSIGMVERMLGENDSCYVDVSVPTYLLSKGDESEQLAFIVNDEGIVAAAEMISNRD